MLGDKLREVSRKSEEVIPEEIYGKMLENLEKLQNTHIEEKVIKVGEKLPDFDLIDTAGKRYTKSEFLGKKIVLNFFRGSWWPYCNLELGVLEEMQDEIEDLGGKLISVSPEKPDKHKSEEAKDAESIISSDIDNTFAKKLGLVFSLSEELNEIYLGFGIDLDESNGNSKKEIPMPATIITDENGVVSYVFAKANHTLRMEPGEILEVLKR